MIDPPAAMKHTEDALYRRTLNWPCYAEAEIPTSAEIACSCGARLTVAVERKGSTHALCECGKHYYVAVSTPQVVATVVVSEDVPERLLETMGASVDWRFAQDATPPSR